MESLFSKLQVTLLLFVCFGLQLPALANPDPKRLAQASENSLILDKKASRVYWKAYKGIGEFVRYSHEGELRMADGSIKMRNGSLVSAQLKVDMRSVIVTDLMDKPNSKSRLEKHLKSSDFFDTTPFPFALFETNKIKAEKGNSNHYTIDGWMTIKGIKKPVSVKIRVKQKNKQWFAEGEASLNRMNWNIRYKSPSLLKTITDPKAIAHKFIRDQFDLKFKLVASPSQSLTKKPI